MMGGPHVNIDKREAKIPADLRRKFPRACPREGCGSLDLKFMFFIRHIISQRELLTQPRYECNGCKKGFTRSGRLQQIAVAATARLAAETNRPSVLMSSLSSESRSSEHTDVEANAIERDEARVEAEECAKEVVGDKRNSWSMGAKVLLREKIKTHLCNAGIVLLEIQVEKYALEACHNHGESDELGRPRNRELSAFEKMERMQRDMFVAAAQEVKAERGKAFKYSPHRYYLLREREDKVTKAEEVVVAMQGQVEEMKIGRVDHSELVTMEKKAQELRKYVDGLDEYE